MSTAPCLSSLGFSTHSVLSDGAQQLDMEALGERASALAEHLKSAGFTRIGLHANNGLEWALVDIACLIGDLCLVPIPTFFSTQQREHVLATCRLDALITDQPECYAGTTTLSCDVLDPKLSLLVNLAAIGEAPLLPVGTGKITFTSGSTGEPKGVCLSHKQLLEQAQKLAELVDIENPKHLCVMPLSTLLENVAGLYAPLLVGGEVLILDQQAMGFSGSALLAPEKLLGTLSAIQPNSLILIPQLLQLLVHAVSQGWQVPASLKFVAVGGSKVSISLLQAAQAAGIPVFEGYGLSECASVVSLNSRGDCLVGSCGRPLPGLNVTLEDGEIMVEGNAMLGYVNEPDSWMPARIETGDLGRLDERGFLHIEGRKKNLLISSYGRNISPEWVESEILANPLLAEAVVVGDSRPYCVALLSLRSADTESEVIDSWLEQLNSQLPDYAQIRAWHRLTKPLQGDASLMTDNGRPRREAISKKFEAEISRLYEATNS